MTPPAVPASPAGPAATAELRAAVLAWFDRCGRRLALRALAPDAWAVLVSEVMAQQTQIGRVEARLPVFLAAFPTPAAMAAAAPADVLRAWRGLGYNRRAIALHRAAVAIDAAGGRVPDGVAGLLALPGVGPYTARAVAAIAFRRPVGAVDVNVRRVVGRLVAGDPAALPARSTQAAADALVDPARPGAWTHALMDLGATVCRPARPACEACPARAWCAAAAQQEHAAIRGIAVAAAAGTAGTATSRSSRPVPFERTTRWLRGRIVDRLRDAPPGVAIAMDGPLGPHPAEAVARALRALERDGVVELDAAGLARLPGARPVVAGGGEVSA